MKIWEKKNQVKEIEIVKKIILQEIRYQHDKVNKKKNVSDLKWYKKHICSKLQIDRWIY